MRIKRIDLLGFKSFCDKASLDFRQRVTGIVGPNGCGKSNVVDALRWAMGEQSARHLRGKTMEDVIFNGSDSRGPSGFAEVAITFDNNDGLVPIEYLGFSEITVARRLHRDGTSEYLINKVPARLRDITNLFLGTGVGTKAYSIIEQGRIGLIVSARPEDRRHFIEEAAGITKYQKRKQAAERRIEATRQNLLRVSDVIEEMSKRLGSLRRQARKAERYKEYRAEMRDIELWVASQRMLENIAELGFRESTLCSLESERGEQQQALEREELVLESARLTAMEEERRLGGLQEALYALDNRIKLNENNVEFRGREAEELEQRAEDAGREQALIEQQLAESALELEAASESRRDLSAEAEALAQQTGTREEILVGVREELHEVRQASEGERSSAAQAERTAARVEASLRALTQRRYDVQEQLDRHRDEGYRVVDRLAGLRASASELDGQLGGLRRTVADLCERRTGAQCRLEELGETARRGEAEIEVLRTELHRRRSRLASLKEIHERYEGFSRGTRAIMQKANGSAKERGILGVVGELVEAPAAYETALEAVLGQRLGTIVVEDDQVGLGAIEYLKQSAEGRSSFIPRRDRRGGVLDRAPVGFVWQPPVEEHAGYSAAGSGGGGLSASVIAEPGVHGPILSLVKFDRSYGQVAESLLGDVVVVENLTEALSLWDRLEDKTLVTLDGEILAPEGTLTGGRLDEEQSGFLRQKREIKELTEIIAELEAQYRERLDAHLAVKTEIASLEAVLEQVTREGHQGDKDILTREKDLGQIGSESDALEERLRELEAEMAERRRTLDELEAQEATLKGEAQEASEQGRLALDILALLSREEARVAGLVESASAAVTDGKVQLAQAEARLRAVEQNLTRIEEARAEKRARCERLQEAAAEGRSRAGALREQVEEMREELRTLVSERAEAQDRFSAARAEYDARVGEVGELEAALKQVRSRVGELGVETGKLQLRVSELRMARQHLEEQIWDRYRESLTRVAGDFHLRPLATEAEHERLGQLRQLIERMGEINLMAIEEFDELNGRHEFLATHKQDLESALSQLARAIQKINRTSRKRFRETFDAVNAKFQEVFPRLFKGGRARLQLTDEENLLEAGVEIIVQPPGKKLQSIDLLSGGEKALTAVSLIFAMFLVKPTPFCLLDEVDAPLDEANVTRFNEMVREMSEASQFILITHNRRTMEIGDRLYGVTMEEPGISKLVSVNLSDIDQAA
jgi:chromosome segregation protein